MTKRLQVLGLCRFSYLAIGGFKQAQPSLAAQRAFLYDPARLDRRFGWFTHVTLPALRAQTDADFTLIVLTGRDFPQFDRLRALVADIPQIRLVQEDPLPHRGVCTAVLHAQIDALAQATAQFRLDDDDAVAVDFVARLRQDYRALVDPLMAGAGKAVALDYSFGITLDTGQTGHLMLHPQISHQHPAALALFTPSGFRNSVMSFAHHKLGHFFPLLSLADQVMFLRGRHAENDSRDAVRVGTPVDLPGPPKRIMRERFAIDLEKLSQELARLAQ
ncbi:glycosyltransferase [Neogemmobacter tilapiae]|uniref:DNA-directed RNA polymerase subunit beta n=1 Tax=Neogemmobacter tilapiae TaxID=875041 RepID=A0A918TSE4_9RHOB|nr:glycosyltransferase [Gemmobacter tilapiae]GHC57124.1 DNA-directed RNA polymerase subunit beta' [Gemmobacter tilapiae]